MKLAERLKADEILVAPGICDAFGMMMVANAGFDAAYLSGASLAYTRHGSPDIGLVTMTEVAETVSLIREKVNSPDCRCRHWLRQCHQYPADCEAFEKCGASAIQLEDQDFPKRCGHLRDKSVIPVREMTGKLKAALDARRSEETLIIARTDAVASEGLGASLERSEHYLETGIDILFVEALTSSAQMRLGNEQFGSKSLLMANMVEGGKTPLLSATELEKIG